MKKSSTNFRRLRRLFAWGAAVCLAAFALTLLYEFGLDPYRPAPRKPVSRQDSSQPRHNPSPGPHVVFISLDTLRPDYLGCYGHPWSRTPEIDALAGESIVFTDCSTVVPTTLASHTSMLTGNYPHTHGVPRNGFRVHSSNLTLAEALRDTGYHTAAFVGAYPIDSEFGLDQGFAHYDDSTAASAGVSGRHSDERPAEQVTSAALAYLDRIDPPRNLFLFCHYFDPHAPYRPPAPFSYQYEEVILRPRDDSLIKDQVIYLTGSARTERLADVLRLYAGEIAYVDAQVGRLLRELKRRGYWDNTLIVLTSDHGETLWDHEPLFEHGLTLFQSTIHAACIVKLPQSEGAGRRISLPVATIDLMPTILDRLGLAPPPGIEGRPLPLDGFGDPARPVFLEATKPSEEVEYSAAWTNQNKARAIRLGLLKYIYTPYLGAAALYNLADDPEERRNLLESGNDEWCRIGEALHAQLARWSTAARPLPVVNAMEELSEVRERLEALGYLP